MTPKTCRLCLCDGKLTSIFDKRDSVILSTKVMSITKVEIYPNDGLPSLICSKCIETLDTCTNFIHVCENSDIKLRTSMQAEIQQKPIITSKKKSQLAKNGKLPIKTGYYSETQIKYNSFKEDNPTDITLNQAFLCDNRTYTHIADPYRCLSDIDEEPKVKRKKPKKQQCFTCGRVMSSRFRLKTHLRTHTGERPYQCPHCNKNFSVAQNLKVHIRIHTGEKPIICNICGETFAQSSGLVVHRRKHTGQTPYKCMLCPRSFRTVGHLQYHTRRHTGEKNFECDTCGRAFITRSDLKQHLITHTGDKPFVCCVCGMRLRRASHLRRHLRYTHNELKLFMCTECPSKFDHKNDLHKHMSNHAATKKQVKEIVNIDATEDCFKLDDSVA